MTEISANLEFQARRLSSRPLIFITPTDETLPIGIIGRIGHLVGDRSVHALLQPAWSLENPNVRRNTVAAYRQHAADFRAHRLLFLCNTAAEVVLLAAEQVPAVLCNQNLFVHENVFRIDRSAPKEFDAIYVGVLRPYKRHVLAREIPRLALIYYDLHLRTAPAYFTELKASLRNAVFVNERYARQNMVRLQNPRAEALVNTAIAARGHVNLPTAEVVTRINRARVGLCLSAEEGAMYASMEYQLCGLPVVTTANRGGRDYFFDRRFCLEAEADAAAVQRAVADLGSSALAPEMIRETALAKVTDERRKLQSILRNIFEAEGLASRFGLAWQSMPLGSQPRCTLARFLAEE